MKKRLLGLLLVITFIVGTACVGGIYFRFVSRTIYTESTVHLKEVFHQANQTLYKSGFRQLEPHADVDSVYRGGRE